MGNAEFLILMGQNVWLFIGCIVVALFVYFLLYRKSWISVLDPISLAWFASAMGFAVMLFLYFSDTIKGIYLFSYLTTQISFIAGFFLLFLSKTHFVIPRKRTLADADQVAKYIFIGATVIDILSQLSSYALVGIPMFMASRLDIMKDAGGAGLLTRMFETARVFSVIMMIYFLMKGKSSSLFRKYIIMYFIYLCSVIVLGGSRSAAVIVYGGAFFMFAISYRNQYPKMIWLLHKYEWRFIVVGVFIAVGIISLQGSGALNSLLTLGFRMVAYGDVYWYAFPNDMIEKLDDSSPFYSLFSSFLGSFRLIPYENLPRPIGMDLFAQLSDADVVGGPNARHNVFGYLYFGTAGGAIFSFICGGVLGYVRKIYLNCHSRSIISVIFISWLYLICCSIETDPNFFIFQVNSFIMVAPFILVVGAMLYAYSRYILRK